MSDWDEHAGSWDEQAGVIAYADQAHASLLTLAGERGVSVDGAVACDFGCGTGLLSERLASVCTRIDAVDTSPAMRQVLADKCDLRGWQHVRVLDRLQADPQGYDLIVCSSVLSFVDDHLGTVRELVGHLAPGGLFVQWDWEADPDDADGGGFTRDDIRAALEGAGLEGVDVRAAFDLSVGGDVMRPLVGSGQRARVGN